MEAEIILTPDELDAIGEIMNISMGASATAVSTLLDRQVTITTPRIAQDRFKDVDCSKLEPAVAVKISYIKGIQGTNIVMFRCHDMQLILDLLMGNEPHENEEFELDEMSMSAACEVMNQMMGASATALSEILNLPINISTPSAQMVETGGVLYETFVELSAEDQIVSISFEMCIAGVMDSDFSFFVPAVLTRSIIDAARNTATPAQAEPAAPEAHQQEFVSIQEEPDMKTEASPAQPQPAAQAVQPLHAAPDRAQPLNAAEYGALEFPPQAPPPGSYGSQPPYGAPPQPGYYPYPPNYYGYPMGYPQIPPAAPASPLSPHIVKQPQVNVKKAQFPIFNAPGVSAQPLTGANAALLMGVPLEVSVVIGKARRKVKDILDFGPGTVVDLDKQTGAPAEIIVNGQLLAYGDVIVIGDNFGVRVTEIVGTKDLLESLEPGT